MNALLTTALVTYALVGGTAVANEVGHGWMAEQMGIGHQHWVDHGGHHCQDHEDGTAAGRPANGSATMPRETCGHHHTTDVGSHHHGGAP